MLFLLPGNAVFRGRSYSVRYLYAGCTHPEFRGHGYYRQLMVAAAQKVEEMGEHAIFLHPADDVLTARAFALSVIPRAARLIMTEAALRLSATVFSEKAIRIRGSLLSHIPEL